ncbi:hypothetical protein [Kitasatospora sp. NPDC057223]|uniref:RipA family octameric membrane protein n=1 Tax=Kitasatospora sp. NPDC057223 TaxID=3346055 RepID=UPI00362F74DD
MSGDLWNPNLQDSDFEKAEIRNLVLEQYKIYVEMADRVSSRRSLANTFFLTLNTAVVAFAGQLVARQTPHHVGLLAFPFTVLVIQCLAWFYLVRSYRQLNSAKYRIVGALEERLPASPYWRAEWKELGEGKDRKKYWPISHVEQWVPLLFALLYAGSFVALWLSR